MKINFFSLIAALVVFSQTGSCLAQSKLKIATLEYRPQIFTENNVIKGICYDIIMEMGKRTDIDVKIDVLPWKRALKMLELGSYDAAFPASITSGREKYAIFMNEPLYESKYGLFVKRGKEFQFNKIDDLTGKNIGIARGNAFTPEFEKAKKANRFTVDDGGNTIEQNFQKLIANRFDVYIVNLMAGLDAVKQLKISNQLTVLPKGLGKGLPKYLMFSKNSKINDKKKIMQLFDRTIEEMKKDGTVDAIMEKYLK